MRLADSEDRDLSDKESMVTLALLALARMVLYMVSLVVVV
jgi:hypothetical protein